MKLASRRRIEKQNASPYSRKAGSSSKSSLTMPNMRFFEWRTRAAPYLPRVAPQHRETHTARALSHGLSSSQMSPRPPFHSGRDAFATDRTPPLATTSREGFDNKDAKRFRKTAPTAFYSPASDKQTPERSFAQILGPLSVSPESRPFPHLSKGHLTDHSTIHASCSSRDGAEDTARAFADPNASTWRSQLSLSTTLPRGHRPEILTPRKLACGITGRSPRINRASFRLGASRE